MSNEEKKVQGKKQSVRVIDALDIHRASRNIYDNLKEADDLPYDISLALARNIRRTKRVTEDYTNDVKALQDSMVLREEDGSPKIRGNSYVFKSFKKYQEETNRLKNREIEIEFEEINEKSLKKLESNIDPNLLEPLLDYIIK